MGREGPRGAAGKARRDAEALVERGRAERDRLVVRAGGGAGRQGGVRAVLAEAGPASREMRLEAEDYVDAKLAQFEIALEKTARRAGALRSARRSGGASVCAAERWPRRSSARERAPPMFDGEEEA